MIHHETVHMFYLRHNPSLQLDECVNYLALKRGSAKRRKLTSGFRRLRHYWMKAYGIELDDERYESLEHYEYKCYMKWKFATIRLTDADKLPLQEFLKEHDNDPENVLQELLSAGLKFSGSFIDDQAAFVVTISGSDRSKGNNGWSLSSWSDDFWEAVAMCGYKHFVLCKGKEWSDLDKHTANWG